MTLWCLAVVIGMASGVTLGQQLVDDAAIGQSPNEEWLTYGGNYAETHFIPLDQIDASNVGRLGLAKQWEVTETAGALETTPLVSDADPSIDRGSEARAFPM